VTENRFSSFMGLYALGRIDRSVRLKLNASLVDRSNLTARFSATVKGVTFVLQLEGLTILRDTNEKLQQKIENLEAIIDIKVDYER
jgi:hypothetical protein